MDRIMSMLIEVDSPHEVFAIGIFSSGPDGEPRHQIQNVIGATASWTRTQQVRALREPADHMEAEAIFFGDQVPEEENPNA